MQIRYLCKKLFKIVIRYKLGILLLIYIMSVVWTYVNEEEGTTKYDYDKNIAPTPEPKYIDHLRKPTIVYWTEDERDNETTESCSAKCDIIYGKVRLPNNTEGAYLFYASRLQFSSLPLPREPETYIWAITHEESPRNVPELMFEKILNIFNYSSTFSRYSDVPYPLQHIVSLENVTSTKYYVETRQKNMFLGELAPILYLQSDCETSTERDKFVTTLQNFQQVDSYGRCLRNKELPAGIKHYKEDYLNSFHEEEFLKFVAKYKFVIAIENGVCEDYITEKFWRALHVGVVPIYYGSPSIRDWLPNEKSAILLEDFPTPELLSRHINNLMQNDTFYEEYLEHKTKGKISNQKIIDELRLRPYQTGHMETENELKCFLCKKLHEKNRGVNVMTKHHYNCPKPISALTQQVEISNYWVESWEFTRRYMVDALYTKIMFT